MKVILVESVIGLGRAGETVAVKAGYARNFLMPKGIAVYANKANMEMVEARKAEMEKADAVKREAAQKLADELAKLSLSIQVETNDDDQMFGSVGVSEIAAAIKAAGIEIERKLISIAQPITELGEHAFIVQCHVDVRADLKVQVVS